MMTRMSSVDLLSRRDLLKAGGALVVTFAFTGIRTEPLGAQAPPAGKPLDPGEVDSFIAIHADGTATVYSGKVDVGTGLRIAVAQMAAEELGLPATKVTVVDGDTGICPDQGGTGGSNGLTRGGTEVRQAAASARQALLAMAAQRLNRPASDLAIVDGQVRPAAGGAGVSFAELIGGRRIAAKVDPKAPLRKPAEYTQVGKAYARPDLPAKCTATHEYVHDVRVPGMLHARVIRPATVGATLASVDESSIAGIPDARVVRVGNFLAVVAPGEWAAVRAATELKAAWTNPQNLPPSAELAQWSRTTAVERDQAVVTVGDAKAAMAQAAKTFASSYYWPMQAHASLGPSCAVADVKSDGTTTVWSASQGTHGLRQNLAKIFGLPVEKFRVVFAEGSGSYGTNGGDYAAADAVLISKTIGRPVRVQWSRADEHGWAPKGPAQLLDLRAGVNAAGHITAWEAEMWLPANRPGARAFLAADAAGLAQENGRNAGLLSQNGDPAYAADNVSVVVHQLRDYPLPISNIRAPGKIANVFAVEAMTDEIAAGLGVDPVSFRLDRLKDPRAIETIRRAADAFKWQPRPAGARVRRGSTLVGQGFAYARYKQNENYVAMAMEVAVDPGTGAIEVRRVVCAHDCGLIVNPDALRNQVEGCIVQTLSRTLHEEATFDRGRVTSVDWAGYPVLRFPEAPSVEVVLIDRPNEPLLGAGEAATAPVPAAVANAVFDATGVRLRTVPFTRARVRAALGASGQRA
jgi:CO/xanthine dehydrogenase Mo-binding subunit